MAETLRWWFVLEVMGLVGLPLAFVAFQRLPDRGYAFAKTLTVLLGAYVFWLALSLHVLPNRPGSIVWCFLALAAVSGSVLLRRYRELREAVSERLPVIVAVEAVFTIALFTAAHLRSYIPEISGTEKPMDFMFLNAVTYSRYYPPDDAWLSGFHVSYYYFGYVIQAVLGRLAAVPPAVAFNLGLASTAALAATAAFGLGFNLVRLARNSTFRLAAASGVAAAVLLLVLGNLEGLLEFSRAHGFGSDSFFSSIGIANLVQAKESASWYPTEQSSFWWWWRATRVCADAGCIMEFPFFSFLLGDLHPHVMAIPYVLTAVALGIGLAQSQEALSLDFWRTHPGLLVIAGLLIGGLGFLNTWDLPTFGALLILLVLTRNARTAKSATVALKMSAGFVAAIVLVAVAAYMPFYVSFSSQASGLGAVSTGATRPIHAILFWLPLVALTLPLALVRLSWHRGAPTHIRTAVVCAIPLLLLALWVVVVAGDEGGRTLGDAVSGRGWNWLTALFFGAAFALSALALWRETDEDSDRDDAVAPALALMTAGYLLIFGAELFFIKDVFNSRLNTVFKLYYQAWLLLAIAGAHGGYWLARRWRPARASAGDLFRGAWAGLAALVVAGSLLYPVGATLSRTAGLTANGRTLDGLASASREDPDEVAALRWLRERAAADDKIVEAVEGEYSVGGRVSARTGVPTVLGWPGHERQWGRDGQMLARRQADVERAYSTDSLAEALVILRKYGVTYVMVGSVERAKYPPAGLQKFADGLPAALTAGRAVIYRVPWAEAGATGGAR